MNRFLKRAWAEIDLDALEPVSYTHLDVYKRQRKGWYGDSVG